MYCNDIKHNNIFEYFSIFCMLIVDIKLLALWNISIIFIGFYATFKQILNGLDNYLKEQCVKNELDHTYQVFYFWRRK